MKPASLFLLLASVVPALALADPTILPAFDARFLAHDVPCDAFVLYVQDVDGDGLADATVVTQQRCTAYSQIRTYLGRADGAYAQGPVTDLLDFYAVPQAADRLVDVDGDGILDVVLVEPRFDANGSYYEVVLLRGDGGGGFGTPRLLWSDPDYVDTVVFGEFTGDGRTDLAFTRSAGGGTYQIVIAAGTAAGPFTLAQTLPPTATAQTGRGLAAAQLDGDGRADLVWSADRAPEVLRGRAGGGFQAPLTLPMPSQLQQPGVADIDGDGRLDVGTFTSSGAWIARQNADGSFGAATITPTLSSTSRFRCADLDGDGKDDLLYPGSTGIVVQPVDGTGLAAARVIQSESPARDWAAGDFDHAGHLDLLVLNSVSALSLHLDPFDAAAGFVDAATAPGPENPLAIDLDRDGNLDAVMTSRSTDQLTILWGDGTGRFSARTDLATGDAPRAVAAALLDGDPWPDLVVTEDPAGTVSVLRGLGGRAFGARVPYAVGGHPAGAAIGDLNGDGVPDVALAQALTNRIQLLPGNGFAGFGAVVELVTGPEPIDPRIADIDRDGRNDLVYGLRVANAVAIRFGEPLGALGSEQVGPGGHHLKSLCLLDDDHDGILDVASCGDDGHVTLARTNPDRTLSGFGAADLPAVLDLAAADFDADGADDLAYVRNGSDVSWVSAAVGILDHLAPGLIVDDGPLFGSSIYGSSIAAGDFNNDHRPDILTVSGALSNATVLLNRGTDPLVGVAPTPTVQARLRFASAMPTRGAFVLGYDAPAGVSGTLRLISPRGIVVLTRPIAASAGGPARLRIEPAAMPPGVYWAEVRQGAFHDALKFVLLP